jgi:hypothetical protein
MSENNENGSESIEALKYQLGKFRQLVTKHLPPTKCDRDDAAALDSKLTSLSRMARVFDWLENQKEFAISPPTDQDGRWHLFHNEENLDSVGETLLETVESAITKGNA